MDLLSGQGKPEVWTVGIPNLIVHICRVQHTDLSCLQASLERVGLDAGKAIARARSRSVSRVGRKRLRDASAALGDAMEVDGSQAPEKKRIHSAKSR